MATMAVLVFVNVVSRYVFNYSIIWVEELTRYMMVWVGFIGLRPGAAVRRPHRRRRVSGPAAKTRRPGAARGDRFLYSRLRLEP